MSMPLVTVITATFNASKVLRRTIDSLLAQTYKNIEYIVIDGGSSDETSDIVREYKAHVNIFVSEKDRGIGDAWNKGLRFAKGEYICLLNAGDEYAPDFIEKNVLSARDNTINYGTTFMCDDDMKVTHKVDKEFSASKVHLGFGFMHTSCFIPSSVYRKTGEFNIEYKIAVDTEWLLRALKLGVSFQKSSAQNFMQFGGVSDAHYLRAQREYWKALTQEGFVGSKELGKVKVRAWVYAFARKLKIIPFVKRARMEVLHAGLASLNFFVHHCPMWTVRKMALKFAGVRIGEDSIVHRKVRLFSAGRVCIGKNSVINRGVYLDNRDSIRIGDHVSVAHDVKIYTTGHDGNDPFFSGLSRPVSIEDYVVIYAGALIMPGVTIGRNAVIYPGSVVTKDVSSNAIVGGNPARQVGERKLNPRYKLYHPYWFAN
ncbi:glycosyltransferase [Bdellovibrio sp. HCB2-146]|uniref:glycosyltransferase n=1 Tax=Bdellovibrio sp. HCB2-146 TaxID=3394362 RepID=UPI0039BD8FC6